MLEDEKIIELFFARSEQAIQALDQKYGKVCHSLSYNILKSPQDAEECVSEAYLGAWNAIPPARPNPLQAYLCKIVRNLSLKRHAHNAAAKRNSIFDVAMQELEDSLSAPDTVESELEARELAQIIEDFLETQTKENRVIFMRRYAYLDPYSEIAARVGLSENNVAVRLNRIRRKLKQYLQERGVFV